MRGAGRYKAETTRDMTEIYSKLSDEELIERLRGGDSSVMEYLLEKYKNLVRQKANRLFIIGGDSDDLIQEGMIGLFKAIRDYSGQQGSFYSFAKLCINRQMYTAIEAASRKKHGPLNSYIPLSGKTDPDEETREEGPYAADNSDPEKILLDREKVKIFMDKLEGRLSRMEKQVFDLYMEGMNYREIATKLNKPDKSIDNALQRIRSKADICLKEYLVE